MTRESTYLTNLDFWSIACSSKWDSSLILIIRSLPGLSTLGSSLRFLWCSLSRDRAIYADWWCSTPIGSGVVVLAVPKDWVVTSKAMCSQAVFANVIAKLVSWHKIFLAVAVWSSAADSIVIGSLESLLNWLILVLARRAFRACCSFQLLCSRSSLTGPFRLFANNCFYEVCAVLFLDYSDDDLLIRPRIRILNDLDTKLVLVAQLNRTTLCYHVSRSEGVVID